MNETLARELAPHAIPAERLPADHRPILGMLSELLGVVPNCYPVLAIWPTGLRTFNVLVPNLLNLPFALVGQGAPKDLVGLALYASSQAAGCSYCIAHHCSWALRRGRRPRDRARPAHPGRGRGGRPGHGDGLGPGRR